MIFTMKISMDNNKNNSRSSRGSSNTKNAASMGTKISDVSVNKKTMQNDKKTAKNHDFRDPKRQNYRENSGNMNKKVSGKAPSDIFSKMKFILYGIIFAVVLLIVFILILSLIGANKVISPEKLLIQATPDNFDLIYDYVDITTENDDHIIGWWIPAQNYSGDEIKSDKTIIMSHAIASNREMIEISLMYLIKELSSNGYNVMTFDFLGSGTSIGKGNCLGSDNTKDLLVVTDYVKNIKNNENIAVLGWATGASAALGAIAQSDDIEAVIIDSCYTKIDRYLDVIIPMLTGLPQFPFNGIIKFLLPMLSGEKIGENDPISVISQIKNKDLLFISGSSDQITLPSESQTLYNMANTHNNTEFYNVDGAFHTFAFIEQEENYVSHVLNFLNKVFEKSIT